MNHRDRALAAMQGEPVDRIPFIARMELWYNYHHNMGTLPHPFEQATLWDIQRDLGIGIMGFGAFDVPFFHLLAKGMEEVRFVREGTDVVRYGTPYGTLTFGDRMAQELAHAAGSAARVEFPFKDVRDYDALIYYVEHMRPVENFDAYGRYAESIGGDGLALPTTGHLPAHEAMIHLMGYERFYYELHDHPTQIERLLGALTDQYREILQLARDGPAPAIEMGGNYDEWMTPPPVFERFFAPLYREARTVLGRVDKRLVVHGDGEMRALLRSLLDCGVEVVEALTPKPMTSIDVAETRRLWKGRVAIWGGLPAVLLTDTFTDDEFERALDALFEAVAPGDRFILGFGDNVPTDAPFRRIRRVAEYWADHSAYPLPLG